MVEEAKLIVECPACGNVWRAQGKEAVESCPKCKKLVYKHRELGWE